MTDSQVKDFDSRTFLRTLPDRPGVYCMRGEAGEVLYVGKARRLKARVGSYFRTSSQSAKTRALMSRVADIQVTVTRTEAEALLLESNLIKAHRPRYNVLLRDDKSYPYVHLTGDHAFARIRFYRGAYRRDGRLFGPYPNAGAVRAALKELQGLFRLRVCEDAEFARRERPCLQHQMGRCSAPCVDLIGPAEYAEDVYDAVRFLEGKSQQVIDELARRMDQAAEHLEFERAAVFRDRIVRLRQVSARQDVATQGGDVDILAVATEGGTSVVALGLVRGGQHLGHQVFTPRVPADTSAEELRTAFLSQHYEHMPAPAEILLDGDVEDADLISAALAEQAGHAVALRQPMRGQRLRWVSLARANAAQSLALKLAGAASLEARLTDLSRALALPGLPSRLECFDISHTQGEATVASCVVFDASGPVKSAYRRFNIQSVGGGDDYGALREALLRRYGRLLNEAASLPDVAFIDGGRGQLGVAVAVMAELGIASVRLVGVAKGPARKAGEEQLFLPERDEPLRLAPHSAALHLIQQIRDEAHRFAITGHRQRRARTRNRSVLEDIPGLGPKRRQQLLRQFGGLQQLLRAEAAELSQVPGISDSLARRIHADLHPEQE
jgi:excinuclease ABC subunit C